MQYTIQLPSDFDEEQVRKRVTERSKIFDGLDGLMHKSFLFNSNDHIYAPFYIWNSVEAAKSFLLNDLFSGVIDTFNRPRVRSWSVISTAYGNKNTTPKFAIREADLISPNANLSKMAELEKQQQQELSSNPNLYFQAVALDADRWEIIRYSLWESEQVAVHSGADMVQTYEVLHVSEPQSEVQQKVA